MVATRKEKIVFNAELRQADAIRDLVAAGRYRSASEFLRDAVELKLADLRRARLEEQLDRYCELGYAEQDDGLIDAQALDEED